MSLKQASQAWFEKLKYALLQKRFVNAILDASLFILKSETFHMILLVYVDNVIITGSSEHVIILLIKELNQIFSLKDLGDMNFFLGLEVTKNADSICLTQMKYIKDLLQKSIKLWLTSAELAWLQSLAKELALSCIDQLFGVITLVQ